MITYIARNTRTGEFYIGSTINFESRKKQHLSVATGYKFHRALQKYPDCFEWETFEDDSSGRELEQALLDMFFGTEMCYNLSPSSAVPDPHNNVGYKWINDGNKEICLRPGEVIDPGWSEGRLPVKDLMREKLRKAHTGKKRPECATAVGRVWVTNSDKSEEKYLKPGEEIPDGWVKGRKKREPRSLESRMKTSKALKGRVRTAEENEKTRQGILRWHERRGTRRV